MKTYTIIGGVNGTGKSSLTGVLNHRPERRECHSGRQDRAGAHPGVPG